ncbi:hypothetical protein M8C21_017258, partial [Ambrosia artemisiifolia]
IVETSQKWDLEGCLRLENLADELGELDCNGSLSSIAPLEAILFDIDGTLCESDPLHFYAFRDMLQEDSISGIKAANRVGMPAVGMTTRNPEQTLLDVGASLVIKDYIDPILWENLQEIVLVQPQDIHTLHNTLTH